MNLDTLDRYSPYMLAVLRIVTALIFIEHGTQKLLGFPAGNNPMPPLFSLYGFAGVLARGEAEQLLGAVLHEDESADDPQQAEQPRRP